MFKSGTLLFLYTETSMHAGSGESFQAIDLAIQRERHTGYPMIAASGVKGGLRDWFSRAKDSHHGPNVTQNQVEAVFGPDTKNASDHGGALSPTDARLLLFPVRTARGVFAWTTSPLAVNRLRRDLAKTGGPSLDAIDMPLRQNSVVYGAPGCRVADGEDVLLEEYAFTVKPKESVGTLARWIKGNALPDHNEHDEYTYWNNELKKRLLILPDAVFRDFVMHATEVQARVKLNDKKTTGDDGNLFYQENLPADSLLYSGVFAGDDLSGKLNGNGTADDVLGIVRGGLDGKRIQLGGDESVGKGICCARFLPKAAGE